MGTEVKKLETKPDEKPHIPDGTKPIAMSYWYSPTNPHTGIGINMVVNGHMNDGVGTEGKIQTITLFPGGFVVVEVLSRAGETKHLVVLGGQGRCA